MVPKGASESGELSKTSTEDKNSVFETPPRTVTNPPITSIPDNVTKEEKSLNDLILVLAPCVLTEKCKRAVVKNSPREN